MIFSASWIQKLFVRGARYLTMVASIGSFAGSVLMFTLGALNIYHAWSSWLKAPAGSELGPGSTAVIGVIEALDRFLIGIVLLYFAYGVYSLFVRQQPTDSEVPVTIWIRIHSIGQLKQVVAEVIIVVLFVLFLRVALEVYRQPTLALGWQELAGFVALPFSTLLLALALRLVQLHPKPPWATSEEDARPAEDRSGPRQGGDCS